MAEIISVARSRGHTEGKAASRYIVEGLLNLQKDTKITKKIIVRRQGLSHHHAGRRKGITQRPQREPRGSKQDRITNLGDLTADDADERRWKKIESISAFHDVSPDEPG